MKAIVFLVEQMAVGLYIVTGVGIYLALRSWMKARQHARATYFELERDIYRYQRANSLTALVLLMEFGLAVLGIQKVVAPTIRAADGTSLTIADVVQDGSFQTPTPAPAQFGNSPIDASGVSLQDEQLVKVLATPTLTPTPVGTILPNPPPISGCDKPNAILQSPANGMLVFEPVNVVGTAYTDNFAFYRFELNGPSTFGNFAPIRTYDIPVKETNVLGQFVPSFYQPGEYQFRVTVFDSTATLKAACTVNITISEPISTATPIGQAK
jgi:hypothetical protein